MLQQILEKEINGLAKGINNTTLGTMVINRGRELRFINHHGEISNSGETKINRKRS